MGRRAFRFLAMLWLCAGAGAASAAETRVALVIGNGAYAAVPRLDNPARDAAAVAEALRSVGFQIVETRVDLGADDLRKALRSFSEQAERADWALVYYAGHGIEVGGVTYLVPVDAALRSDRDVGLEAVTLEAVLTSLEGARKLRLVILDACRDNPFLAGMRRSLASRSVGRGLGRVEPDLGGTLVAYAAKAGQTAADGAAGDGNSPYAAALARNIVKPGVEVEFMFRQVRADVLAATSGRQDPATYGALPPERFLFKLGPEAPAAAEAPPAEVAAPPPLAGSPKPGPDAAQSVVACDRLAGNPGDPDRARSVAGVDRAAIDPRTAIPACRSALAAAPDERRIAYQLGRAYEAADKFREASDAFLKAAVLGSAFAMTEMGINYHQARGVRKDQQTGRRWFEKAAALGDRNAMHNLGLLYELGDGVTPDMAEARRWFEKSAALGQRQSALRLSKLKGSRR